MNNSRRLFEKYLCFILILSVITGTGYLITGPSQDNNKFKNYYWPEDEQIEVETIISLRERGLFQKELIINQ
jgi:hypothetical protein